MTTISGFKIIGISARTTNKNNQSAQDIGKLWGRFYGEKLFERIPNKLGNDIYAIYTDYTSDYTEDYTVIIGAKVSSLDSIPAGLTGREFPTGNFVKFIAKGQMPESVIDAWAGIWTQDKELNRQYAYDFEIYGDKSQRGEHSEIEIYISTKSA